MRPKKGNKKGLLAAGTLTAWMLAGAPLLVLCGLFFGIAGMLMGTYLSFSADLPKIPDLKAYRPKTVSTFYAEDGTVIGLFYREKRFPVPLDSIPPHVVNAFLAAEDARFFSHPGVDWLGVIRALVRNIRAGTFAQGGSTITQQVTRNFLLTKEKKISRKIREALLAFRLEKTLSKQEILGLYLNEVYLGHGAYGVESAARTYFGKSCGELTVGEAALLAGLVAGPSKYSPKRNLEAALDRRAYVLGAMLRNGFIAEDEHARAIGETPTLMENLPNPYQRAPYFTEAARQYIIERYGEDRLYDDGLQVWTACDLSLQDRASDGLEEGVIAWERRQGRPSGLVSRLKPREARDFLDRPPVESCKVGDLLKALIVQNHSPEKRKKKDRDDTRQECTLALPGNIRFSMALDSKIRYRPNDLLEFMVSAVEGNRLTLEHQTLPPIQGALVCMENRTGYVRALVGGLDFERSSFNRALQAMRQPGSAFKALVYAAALEWSDYSPHTVIVDEPIAVALDPRESYWVPMNSDGRFLGPITVRQALAYSRNTATVKVLMDVGIDSAIAMAHRLGVSSPLGKHLSISLGASEVTPLELTAAYSVFPNLGTKVHPVLIKKVVDRFGRVLEDNTAEPLRITAQTLRDEEATLWLRNKATAVAGLGPAQLFPPGSSPISQQYRSDQLDVWNRQSGSDQESAPSAGLESLLSGPGSKTPVKVVRRPDPARVLSPQTAYLMSSMLREACVSGTAAAVSRLRRKDLAGKTGTTDDCTDAWFIGFNPRYTTGVWVGYDAKVSLGRKEFGATAAMPIWMNFMKEALKGLPPEGYTPPPGIAFSGNAAIPAAGSKVQDALLEARPDLAADLAAKDVSPIDLGMAPASAGADPLFRARGDGFPMLGGPWQGGPMFAQSVYDGISGSPYPGMIRVLSPNGETLGHASYSTDERGRMTVHPESVVPAHETQHDLEDESPRRTEAVTRRESGPFSFVPPAAASLLRGLQRFIPRALQFE